MSDIKFVFIMDKEDVYVSFARDKFIEKWSTDDTVLKSVTDLSTIGGQSLFDDVPLVSLTLEKKDDAANFSKYLEGLNQEDIEDNFPAGLIVSSTVAKNSLKKVEAQVKRLGGRVEQVPTKERNDLSSKLLSEVNFNREVRKFLIDYAGQEFEQLIPIIRSVNDVKKQDQQKITVESISTRLPSPPGAIPPWSIENPLFDGDTSEAINVLHRATQGYNKHILVLWAIRTKLHQVTEIASLLSVKPSASQKDISGMLHVANNYGVTVNMRRAKKIGLDTLIKADNVLLEYDKKIRGHSSVDVMILMETLLIELCSLFTK